MIRLLPKSSRKSRLSFCICALLACVVLAAGCESASEHHHYTDLPSAINGQPATPNSSFTQVALTNRIESDWLKPPPNRFTLGPGDKIEIELIGDATSKTDTVVGPDGKIYFNLLPGIDVWGSTLPQVKAKLENELGKYLRGRPQVSLTVLGVESKRIWIMGRVQAPGVYSMTAPMTLLEAIAMAGGTMTLSNFQDQEAAGIDEELA
ncbi:MAG TPA: polysaccharide biosynthesis/export family protein, partial [Verrucomicrobiae bacterium]|nr:polysaccharide biosynthesis/export family protein [Verrucomicrobiae bacterium]